MFSMVLVGKIKSNLSEYPVYISFRWKIGVIVEDSYLFDTVLVNAKLELFTSLQEEILVSFNRSD